jgi:hypothetical protein
MTTNITATRGCVGRPPADATKTAPGQANPEIIEKGAA